MSPQALVKNALFLLLLMLFHPSSCFQRLKTCVRGWVCIHCTMHIHYTFTHLKYHRVHKIAIRSYYTWSCITYNKYQRLQWRANCSLFNDWLLFTHSYDEYFITRFIACMQKCALANVCCTQRNFLLAQFSMHNVCVSMCARYMVGIGCFLGGTSSHAAYSDLKMKTNSEVRACKIATTFSPFS